MQPSDAEELTEALTPQFLVELAAVQDAIACGGLFQGLDQETFLKIDFHVNGSIRGEFERSVVIELFPEISVPIASKCDAILSKLLWVQAGSGKSREDILGMLRDPQPFDEQLLLDLAQEYEVAEILTEIREQLI